MTYDPRFMGVDNIGSTQLLNELQNNYKSFLDWGFLNIGGFTNVSIPTVNISNFDLHILKPTKDKNRTDNTVWQSARKDWVYETGISYNGTSPLNISGVYVNSVFYPGPTGNASVGYKINYPEGKIIFNNPLPSSTSVQINYSYRNIQVYKIDEFPLWKELQHRSLENKPGLSLSDKGDFSIGSEHRTQLPCVILESVPRANNKPFRLGDKSLIIEQDILIHILSDHSFDKNNIIDIVRLQEDREIWLYNTNSVIKSGIYPLKYDGSKNINGQNYNIIVNNDNYRWLKCRMSKIDISNIIFDNIRLYGGVVRVSNQIIFTDF